MRTYRIRTRIDDTGSFGTIPLTRSVTEADNFKTSILISEDLKRVVTLKFQSIALFLRFQNHLCIFSYELVLLMKIKNLRDEARIFKKTQIKIGKNKEGPIKMDDEVVLEKRKTV